MSEQELNKKTYNAVNVILLCDILTQSNDELKGTQAYDKDIALHSKGLGEALEKVLGTSLAKMFAIDQETYQNLALNLDRYQQTMSKAIVDMKPNEFIDLNQIIELYINNKEKFQETFEITLRKIDNG